MLWDTLYIEQHKFNVVRNKDIGKIHKLFLYIIPLVCTAICYVIIMNVDAVWRYLTVPGCVLFFLMYKFYYLPSQDIDDVLLSVQQDKIIYVDPDAKYIIPILSVEKIKDQSVYFDFRGRGNHGWEHSIVIEIRKSCKITKVTSDGEETRLHCSDSHPISVVIDYLQLEHNDHEKLYTHLQQIIATNKEISL